MERKKKVKKPRLSENGIKNKSQSQNEKDDESENDTYLDLEEEYSE